MEKLTGYEKLKSIKSDVKNLSNKLSSKFILTPENIPNVTYPIVNFIHQEQPDYILAFDRGARIIALATHMLYRDIYGQLPTRDRKINFRKVSRKVPREEMRTQFKSDVEQMMTVTDSPKVLLLDDWVLTGETKNLAKEFISEFSGGKAEILFGVMRGKGKGADISGDRNSFAYYAWRNKA